MPAVPTFTLTSNTDPPHVGIQIVNSDTPARNEIWRYEAAQGASSAIRIAYAVAVDGFFTDYHIGSDRTYVYFVRAVDSGGAYADSVTASVTLTLLDAWLHPVTIHSAVTNRANAPVKLLNQEPLDLPYDRESVDYHHGGRSRSVIGTSPVAGRKPSFPTTHLNQETKNNLQAIFNLKTTLCFRSQKDEPIFCSQLERQTTDRTFWTNEGVSLIENSFSPVASSNVVTPENDYLLLETGFGLLMEDGGRVILEA